MRASAAITCQLTAPSGTPTLDRQIAVFVSAPDKVVTQKLSMNLLE
jgi:hypothetical protein